MIYLKEVRTEWSGFWRCSLNTSFCLAHGSLIPDSAQVASWRCLPLSDAGLQLVLHWRTISHGCLELVSICLGLGANNFLFPCLSHKMSNIGRFPMIPCSKVHSGVLCPQIHFAGKKFNTRDWVSCLRSCASDVWCISEGHWGSCPLLFPLSSTTPSPGLIFASLMEKETELGKDTLWICEVAQLWSQLDWPLMSSIQVTQWHSIFLRSELLYPGDITSSVSSSCLCYMKLPDSWVPHIPGDNTCTTGFHQKLVAPWGKKERWNTLLLTQLLGTRTKHLFKLSHVTSWMVSCRLTSSVHIFLHCSSPTMSWG